MLTKAKLILLIAMMMGSRLALGQCGSPPVVWVYGYSCVDGSAVFYGGTSGNVTPSTIVVSQYDGNGNYYPIGNLANTQFTFNDYHRAGNGYSQSYFYYRFNYGSGCTSSYFPVEVEDKVLQKPTVTGNQTACSGQALSLTISPDYYGDGNYRWYNYAGTVVSTSNHFTPTVYGQTTYYVAGYAANDFGCESERTAVVVNVVTPPAAPTVTHEYCQLTGGSVTLTASLPNATSYRWYNNDYDFITETTQGSYITSVTEDAVFS